MATIKLKMKVEGHDGTGHTQAAQVVVDGSGEVVSYYPPAVELAAQGIADGADHVTLRTKYANITLTTEEV